MRFWNEEIYILDRFIGFPVLLEAHLWNFNLVLNTLIFYDSRGGNKNNRTFHLATQSKKRKTAAGRSGPPWWKKLNYILGPAANTSSLLYAAAPLFIPHSQTYIPACCQNHFSSYSERPSSRGLMIASRTLTVESIHFMKIHEGGGTWRSLKGTDFFYWDVFCWLQAAPAQPFWNGQHVKQSVQTRSHEVINRAQTAPTLGWRLGCSSTYPLGSMAK